MKLIELKERIDRLVSRDESYGDLEVVIPNGKAQMGAIGTTRVKSAHKGIDWEGGYFLIHPEVEMIEDNKPKNAQ